MLDFFPELRYSVLEYNRPKVTIRGSSNGRTTGSGPVYLGSNPGPRAKNEVILNFVFVYSTNNIIYTLFEN